MRLLMVSVVVFSASLSAVAQSPPTREEGWTSLWNGKDLTGWQQVGPGKFEVEDGALRTEGGMGLLWFTPRKVENAVVRVVFKPESKLSNAGVFIRIPEQPTEPWMPVHKGYEVQIYGSGDEYHVTGALYSIAAAKARPMKPGEWNTMEITLEGPRTVVRVNGTLVTDFTEGQPVPEKKPGEPERGRRPDAGYIGLQNHGAKDVVWFKEVSMKPLGAK